MSHRVPFNHPQIVGRELEYIAAAVEGRHLSGDGPFSARCHAWLEARTGAKRALLTHSCTAALEMAAILAGIAPGDEVIMPSFTFVSTANAVVLRGGVPVFVDVRADTLNLDETLIAAAITPRTRAICTVHYAGVACDMAPIMRLAGQHELTVIEDAAQGLLATYRDRPLGSIGHLAALSFHETKNVISGEGGALLINDPALVRRAEIVREKGTNRGAFLKGEVDKYTWVDVGSSFPPGELVAAYLYAQFEQAEALTASRQHAWNSYHAGFAALERQGLLRRPVVPQDCGHNAHIYHLILPSPAARTAALARLKAAGINAIFHYVPLHDSPAGKRYGRPGGPLPVTEDLSARLIRLPLWSGIPEAAIAAVIAAVHDAVTAA